MNCRTIALVLLAGLFPLHARAIGERPPTDEARWSEIFIEGEDAPNGIYDPSMEYGPDGVGWMAYSAVKAGKVSRVETRIARSDDNGRTWRRVAKVNRASPAASTLANGEAVSGRWWHETASLVHTPGDAGREWKLFWHRYLSRQPYRGPHDRKLEIGWIAYSHAPYPEGPWSDEVALFGAGPFPVSPFRTQFKLGEINRDLADYIILTEPGTLFYKGRLYLSLQAIRNPVLHGGKVLADTILLASDRAGENWSYVAKLLTPEDAAPYAGDWFTGSSLAVENDRIFLLVAPEQLGNARTGHRGTVVFEFDDIATGRLRRGDDGAPQPVKFLPPQQAKGGQSDYDEANVNGGIVMPQFDRKHLPRPFGIYSTGKFIADDRNLKNRPDP